MRWLGGSHCIPGSCHVYFDFCVHNIYVYTCIYMICMYIFILCMRAAVVACAYPVYVMRIRMCVLLACINMHFDASRKAKQAHTYTCSLNLRLGLYTYNAIRVWLCKQVVDACISTCYIHHTCTCAWSYMHTGRLSRSALPPQLCAPFFQLAFSSYCWRQLLFLGRLSPLPGSQESSLPVHARKLQQRNWKKESMLHKKRKTKQILLIRLVYSYHMLKIDRISQKSVLPFVMMSPFLCFQLTLQQQSFLSNLCPFTQKRNKITKKASRIWPDSMLCCVGLWVQNLSW